MKKSKIRFGLTLIVMFYISSLFSQVTTFNRIYGGLSEDFPFSVKMTSDNGYIVTGYTKSFGVGGRDVYVIKTDSLGDTLWTRTYGGISDDEGHDIIEIVGEGYLVCGSSNSAGNYNLLKIDNQGNIIWLRSIPGSCNQIKALAGSLNQYIICGQSSNKFSLSKIDGVGDTLWFRTYSLGMFYTGGVARSVVQTSDNDIIAGGRYYSLPEQISKRYIIKIDSLGNIKNSHLSTGDVSDVAKTGDGNLIGGGGFYYVNTTLFTYYKFNSFLNFLWAHSFSQMSVITSCYAVVACEGNEYGFAGTRFYSGGVPHGRGFLVRTDANGDTLWTTHYSSVREIRSLQQTDDKGFIIVGPKGNNICLMKTDSLGDVYSQTGVSNSGVIIRKQIDLFQNYPNPFNPKTIIKYYLTSPTEITLTIYDVIGERVATLINDERQSGLKQIEWNAGDLTSGIYYYEIKSKDFRRAKRMVLLK